MSKAKVTSIRSTGQAPEARPLPDEARSQLGTLVTEVSGVAKVLRAQICIVGDDEDLYAAVSMWVDRIAADLGAMECRRYPCAGTEAP